MNGEVGTIERRSRVGITTVTVAQWIALRRFSGGWRLAAWVPVAVMGAAVAVAAVGVGLLVALLSFFLIIFATRLGAEHSLFIYTAGPEWTFTDMRGFGSSLGPWLWFKLYWGAWALLLAFVGEANHRGAPVRGQAASLDEAHALPTRIISRLG